jgi:hypothetical protein
VAYGDVKKGMQAKAADLIKGELEAMARIGSEGDRRYLRPSRTNDRVYEAIKDKIGPMTKYERSILRGMINEERMSANTYRVQLERAKRDAAAAASNPLPAPPKQTFEATARVYFTDQFGNVKSTVGVFAGLEAVNAELILARVRKNMAANEEPIEEAKYQRWAKTGAMTAAGPASIWKPTHAQIFKDKME